MHMSLYNSFSRVFNVGRGTKKTINTTLLLFGGGRDTIGHNNILSQLTGQAMRGSPHLKSTWLNPNHL